MTQTLTYTGTLVIETCWCGIQHAIPKSLRDHVLQQQRDGLKQTAIYCPIGHSWIFSGKGEAEVLREENERLQRVAASRQESLKIAREQRDTAQRSNTALKGVVTRTKRKAAHALCPVEGCGRSFVQVQRHLSSQHPDWVKAHEQQL